MVLGLGEHRAQPALDLVELGRTHRQRRGQLDDRVAPVVGPAVEAGVEERLGEEAPQQPLALILVEGLPGRLVLDELDPVEVAGAADVADEWQVEQLLERRLEDRGVLLDVVVEALALEDVEVGHRRGRRDGVTAPGVPVREVRRARAERLEEPVAGDHHPERGVAARDALGGGDDVGDVVEVVTREHRADPAERADRLVRDEEDVVLVADLADPLEVAGGRREAAAGVLDRLSEDGRDRARTI